MIDRWIAVLEAAAFTPIRAQLAITSKPASVPAELVKTIERLASLLPQIATAFGIEAASSHAPKPLRPTRPTKKLPPRPPARPPVVATTAAETAAGSPSVDPSSEAASAAPVVDVDSRLATD